MDGLDRARGSQRLLDARLDRRRLMRGAAGAGLAAPAVLRGRPAAAQDVSGEITVWTWPDNDKTFEKTIPIFQSRYPEVTVKVQAYGEGYHDKLLSALVSGSGPDVAMIEIGNVAKFKDKPGFVDLTQEPYSATQYADGYADFAWGYVSDQASGRVFALPKNTGPGGLFYRRDVFEQAGLPTTPDEVRSLLKTWDDLLNLGKELTVEGERWMVSSPGQIFYAVIAQAGVSYFNEAGELQLQDPAIRTALEYVHSASEAGIISPIDDWTPEWGAALKSGTIATHLWGN